MGILGSLGRLGDRAEAMFAEARRLRTMLGVEGSIDPSQDYLGAIDPASEIVMKPEEYLSADDLAAVHLHVLDCGLFGNSCNNSFPHMNGGSYYDSG